MPFMGIGFNSRCDKGNEGSVSAMVTLQWVKDTLFARHFLPQPGWVSSRERGFHQPEQLGWRAAGGGERQKKRMS